MITSKSKAIETDCRSLLVYIKLLCDSTMIIWTLAFEGFHFKKQLYVNRGRSFGIFNQHYITVKSIPQYSGDKLP